MLALVDLFRGIVVRMGEEGEQHGEGEETLLVKFINSRILFGESRPISASSVWKMTSHSGSSGARLTVAVALAAAVAVATGTAALRYGGGGPCGCEGDGDGGGGAGGGGGDGDNGGGAAGPGCGAGVGVGGGGLGLVSSAGNTIDTAGDSAGNTSRDR